MIPYEEAVKRWAAGHLGLVPAQWQFIDSVEFNFVPGGSCGYDTCEYPSEIVVSVVRGMSDREITFTPGQFGTIVQEIVAVASSGS